MFRSARSVLVFLAVIPMFVMSPALASSAERAADLSSDPYEGPSLEISAPDGVMYEGCHTYEVTVTVSDLPDNAISWGLSSNWIHNVYQQAGAATHDDETPSVPTDVRSYVDAFQLCPGDEQGGQTRNAQPGTWVFETCVQVETRQGVNGYCPREADGTTKRYRTTFTMREPDAAVVLRTQRRTYRVGQKVRLTLTSQGETPTGMGPWNTVCLIRTWRVQGHHRAPVRDVTISKFTGPSGVLRRTLRLERPGRYELRATTHVDPPYYQSPKSTITIRMVR